MKQNNIILIITLLVAIFLRFYHINNIPSLNPDEAALGYNAYSLLQTGKDEHGISWPIHFKSFSDYKPGGYVYLAMPFVKVLGLTPLAVRLPNLILSILTIYILYKLVLLLSSSSALANYSSIVLSLSPWHIHFSRGAWETSAALFFIVLGVYWFYAKKYYLFLIPIVASLYIYHSARLIAPLLVLFLFINNWRLVFREFRVFLKASLFAFILALPVAFSFLNSGGTTRLGGVGLSADYGPIARAEELLNQDASTELFYRGIHNRRLLYTLSWAQKYLSHFDLNFLFVKGDEVPRSKSPDMAQLYLFELPLIILGILFLLANQRTRVLAFLTFAFLLIAPIPSSLTFQAPSALRSLSLTIPISILIGSGLYYFFELTKSYLPHNLFLISILYIYSLFYFIDAYFIHAPIRYSFAWNSGFSEIVPYLNSQKDNYQNIYFTSKYDQPYILYLFYSQYPPSDIQKQIKLTTPDKFGFSTVEKIDNITFNIPSDIPPNSLIIDEADFQKRGESFKIYTK